MNLKNIVINSLAASLLCGSSLSVLANEFPFKIAVIQNAVGTKDISSGNYNKFINSQPNDDTIEGAFERNMNLCAAYINTAKYDKSESACTAAINTLELISLSRQKSLYLKALSFSNRGVSRYLNDDVTGSMDDFTTAILADGNTITKSNLKIAKHGLLKEEEKSAVALSD
jgi:hypothetical protein